MKLNLDAAQSICVDLICPAGAGVAMGAHHDRGLRAPCCGAWARAQTGFIHQYGAPRHIASNGFKLIAKAALGCLGLQQGRVHIVALEDAAVLGGLP